jgi:hypothetical protein
MTGVSSGIPDAQTTDIAAANRYMAEEVTDIASPVITKSQYKLNQYKKQDAP